MRGIASDADPRARLALGVLLLALALLATGCTDLQVSARLADPQAVIPGEGAFRFVREPLPPTASAPARTGDGAARAAIAASLADHGYRLAGPGETVLLLVDFTLQDGIATNAARLDGPSDYRRSWRAGSAGDGTGSMDHTVADSAFRRELVLTVLLRPVMSATAAWEGRVSRSVAPDFPDEELEALLQRMCSRLLRELP